MAYDEELAHRIRESLQDVAAVVEKRMFGGLAFMVGGHLAVAASSRGGLLLRVHPHDEDELLALPGASPFEMQGRHSPGWLRLDEPAVETDEALGLWVERALRFVQTLPPKTPGRKGR